MSKEVNNQVLSDFEIILPWDVIETCCNLKQHESSCFVSENFFAQTSNQLFISKLEDNSIKVRITVTSLKHMDSNSSVYVTEEMEIESNHIQNTKMDPTKNNENASTIIIVKSNSPKHFEQHKQISISNNQPKEIIRNGDNPVNKKTSEVKYKKDKPFASKQVKFSPPIISSKKESQSVVQCELCGDAVVGYGPLYKHVRWAHGEGTFVQNYLDELRPLVKSWAVEQHKKSQYRQKEFFSSLDFIDSSNSKDISKTNNYVNKEPSMKKPKKNSTPIISNKNNKQVTDTSKNLFHCKICGIDLSTMNLKISHEKKCSKGLQFICDFCSPKKRFSSRKNMLRHVNEVHVGKRATPHMLQGTHVKERSVETKKKNLERNDQISGESTKKQAAGSSSTPANISHSCDLCHEEFASLNLLVCHSKYCRTFPL